MSLVDEVRGGQVMAQRFLQHHARQRCDHLGLGQILAYGGKQIRGRRKEEHAHHVVALLQ